jgi:hypothetical protein
MRITKRGGVDLSYEAGRRALAKHDPVKALPHLREAFANAHPKDRSQFLKRVYWLSLALIKLGKDGLAIKALASAQALAPRGRIRALYNRVANEYGMPRSSCAEHDDYKAFFAIQVRRYLAGMPGRRFRDQTEMDAVLQLIADAWLRLAKERDMNAFSCSEKLDSYKAFNLEFPILREGQDGACRVLAGDFRAAASFAAGNRCPCGSGLPAQRCCARVQLPFET